MGQDDTSTLSARRVNRRLSIEDAFGDIRTWLGKLQHSGVNFEDPVYEGLVRDFNNFDHTLAEVNKGVEQYMAGVDMLCKGMASLSEAIVTGLTKKTDEMITKDSIKYREATHKITRFDAPHSAAAKLQRDIQFNVLKPLKNHLVNNKQLRADLDYRRRKVMELHRAQLVFDQLRANPNVATREKEYVDAENVLKAAKASVRGVDTPVFEWLMMLEAYKCDIFDSTLQTIKYLQYEFFAASAHAVSHVLPPRMEFRPMIEMTPSQLEPQVAMEIAEHEAEEEDGDDPNVDITTKMLDKWEREGAYGEVSDGTLAVDPLSLSVLMGHGFEEGPARKALKYHHNNTQAALDWLLAGMPSMNPANPDTSSEGVSQQVRLPTTLRWMKKLRLKKTEEKLQQKKERKKQKEAPKNKRTYQAESRRVSDSGKRALEEEAQNSKQTGTKTNDRKYNDNFYDESSSSSENDHHAKKPSAAKPDNKQNLNTRKSPDPKRNTYKDSSDSSSYSDNSDTSDDNNKKNDRSDHNLLDFDDQPPVARRPSNSGPIDDKIFGSLLDLEENTTNSIGETPPPTNFSKDINMKPLPDLLGGFNPSDCILSSGMNENMNSNGPVFQPAGDKPQKGLDSGDMWDLLKMDYEAPNS